jgi:hypothetical protein
MKYRIFTELIHSMQQRPSWVAQMVKKFPDFLDPLGSLPCTQHPTSRPYPEPAKSSPHSHSISQRIILILSSTCHTPRPIKMSLTFRFQRKILYIFIRSYSVLHVSPISSFLIQSLLDITWKLWILKILAVQIYPYSFCFHVQIFSSASCSQIPFNLCFFSSERQAKFHNTRIKQQLKL